MEVSRESAENNGNGSNTMADQAVPQQAEPFREQPAFPSLNKQSSIFSLTFNEIECKSGWSFGSMNMEEFIANIWSVEENQVSPQQANREEVVNSDKIISTEPINSNSTNSNVKTTLSRQGSFSIPIPLCKKTVDEIWCEIHKDEAPEPEPEKETDFGPQRQQTLGEMTLEDFLVKAGVVQESPSTDGSNSQNKKVTFQVEKQSGKAENGIPGGSSSGFSSQNHYVGNGSCSGFAAYQVYGRSTSGVLVGQQACNSVTNGAGASVGDKGDCLTEASGAKTGKKRIIDGPPEVVVERRQRRMIKNRESAARSRARKQAYTVELEVELNQLKEENEKLKQIMAEIELKRKREVLMKRKQYSTRAQKLAEKLRAIRRAASLAW